MYLKKLCERRIFYLQLEGEIARKRREIEREIVLYHVTNEEKDYAKLRLDKETSRDS